MTPTSTDLGDWRRCSWAVGEVILELALKLPNSSLHPLYAEGAN